MRPKYCDLIRQEANNVLGPREWQFNKTTLRQLTKLDSFCKETHRHYPASASKYRSLEPHPAAESPVLTKETANFFKKVHKTITLPNGTTLRKGTIFEVVIQPANLRNPKLNHPAEWDGLRYHDVRKQGGFSDKLRRENEWGAATRDDMSFGYGSHLCPGKAHGCDMLKIFFVKLFTMYELKLEDGASERYKSVDVGQYVSAHGRLFVFSSRRSGERCAANLVVQTRPDPERALLMKALQANDGGREKVINA